MKLRNTALSLFSLCLAGTAMAASINPSDLVIYRVGDGGAALGTTATSVFMDEYTTAGALVQSIALPNAGANALTAVGNATTEGILSLDQSKSTFVFTGYRKDAGLSNPSSDAPGTTGRLIGTLGLNGVYSTSIVLTDPTGTIRSATTTDGSAFYFATSAAVRYLANGVGGTTTQIDARNSRQALMNGNDLFASNGSTAVTGKVQTYGTLPTGATAASPIVTLATADAVNGFALFDLNPSIAGNDTLYALSTVENLLRKYTFDGSLWTASGSVSASGAQNITGAVDGNNVTLFLTSSSTLYKAVDTSGYGGIENGTLSSIATAGVNTAFRGIAIVPEPTGLMGIGFGLLLALRKVFRK